MRSSLLLFYPKKKQEILIAKTIGYSRFVFNFLLSEWMSLVKEENQIA
ncbi:helix-turn-helix domain-containing protein [Bacillus cereus]